MAREIIKTVDGYAVIDENFNILYEEKSSAALSTDATGHEHKGKGEGGGQFVSGSGSSNKSGNKAAGVRRKDRSGFKSAADNVEKHKVGARVTTDQGAGIVDEIGDFYAWVKLDKDGSIVKVLHKDAKPEEDTPPTPSS